MDLRRRRTWIAVVLASLVLIGAFAVLAVVAARAERSDREDRSSNTSEAPGIIPRPLTGEEPEHAGDRGGWAQLALLGVVIGALALIGGLAYRSRSRPARHPPG